MRIKKTKNCPECGYPLIRDYVGFILEGKMECPRCHVRLDITTATSIEFLKSTTTLTFEKRFDIIR